MQHHPGPGPSVILLHGAGGNAATWAPVLDAWAWADVWIPDLPGRGATPGAPCATVEAMAAWLAAQGDALPWRDPVVVGHSLGGAVAMALAVERPGLMRFTFVSSGARLKVAPAILAAVDAATDAAPFELTAAFGADAPAAVVSRYLTDAASTPAATTAADWHACNGFDLRAALPGLRDPAIIAYGAADRLTPAKRQAWLAEALDAPLHAVDGAGHMLPWERPAALSACVRAFATGG